MELKTFHTKSPVSGKQASVAKWTLLAGEIGAWGSEICNAMSVHVYGTFNGAVCSFEGSNEIGGEGVVLSNSFSGDLVFQEAGLKAITSLPAGIRPRIEGGDADTKIIVVLYMVS